MRRICTVTGSRADYGLLYWTLRGIEEAPDLELQLLVTGSHLSPAHGLTVREIEADGLPIAARVDMELGSDDPVATGQAMGRALSGFCEALARLQPNLLLLLGDRYEILAAAQAATLLRIPICHLHGGELSEGAFDDAIRHALSKLAHIHCVAAEPYARRVIQMGEDPARVQVVGATGLDALARTPPMERAALEAEIGWQLGERNFLVTLHPETLSDTPAETQAAQLLTALDAFPEARVLITGSNADPAGRALSEHLRRHAESRPDRFCYRDSLGSRRYLNLLRHIDVVIGNSSSGIIEAPAAGCPVVNIGERQKNRLRAPAVIDCTGDAEAIRQAIEQALSDAHRALAARRETPYGGPGAAQRIVRILRETPLEGLLRKRFFDLPVAIPPT